MRNKVAFISIFFLLSSTCLAQERQRVVTETEAREIAQKEAGCHNLNDCEVKGGFRDGKWVFVVSFIVGRDPQGEPQFVPGGWVGITVSLDGKIIDRMPGA